MTQSIQSGDSNATESFGEQLGQQLRGGEIIELISDLGGGKTTLARGIARGAGSKDLVGSPTFTLSKVYKAPKFDIHHFDFYRLSEPGLMVYELQDLLNDSAIVLIIEWGGVVRKVLPSERVSIHISASAHGDNRDIICKYPGKLSYLFA